jgi:hypothetical protein
MTFARRKRDVASIPGKLKEEEEREPGKKKKRQIPITKNS